MTVFPEGFAVVYCEGAFTTPNGKTAHGLVRRTRRYDVVSIIDSHHAGEDAGMLLDGKTSDIPVLKDIHQAVAHAETAGLYATHMVIGLAPDGGRLNPEARNDVMEAIRLGLHIDSGLHDFLSDDPEITGLADKHGVRIRDVRKPPHRDDLHFYSGKIEQVAALKVAVLGTDSAVGKRTTAWILVDALQRKGYRAELIGTGQTAWMQGVRYGIILDSLINDFVAGEIEHVIWKAWKEVDPDIIVIEGQGSLMNPAYPGGFEILAAGRPDAVILQHAPGRIDYDGFPGYPLHPLERQIKAIELLSDKPVIAIAVNHENLAPDTIMETCDDITRSTGLPACDVLLSGAGMLVDSLHDGLVDIRK